MATYGQEMKSSRTAQRIQERLTRLRANKASAADHYDESIDTGIEAPKVPVTLKVVSEDKNGKGRGSEKAVLNDEQHCEMDQASSSNAISSGSFVTSETEISVGRQSLQPPQHSLVEMVRMLSDKGMNRTERLAMYDTVLKRAAEFDKLRKQEQLREKKEQRLLALVDHQKRWARKLNTLLTAVSTELSSERKLRCAAEYRLDYVADVLGGIGLSTAQTKQLQAAQQQYSKSSSKSSSPCFAEATSTLNAAVSSQQESAAEMRRDAANMNSMLRSTARRPLGAFSRGFVDWSDAPDTLSLRVAPTMIHDSSSYGNALDIKPIAECDKEKGSLSQMQKQSYNQRQQLMEQQPMVKSSEPAHSQQEKNYMLSRDNTFDRRTTSPPDNRLRSKMTSLESKINSILLR
jgi:hypothetical protein